MFIVKRFLGLLAKKFKVLLLPSYLLDLIQV
uniref:Uncharacterized protein n=1 Tax=Siphoviridae sp. ctCIv11 TaxID=2827806 RepID=A0A8S5S339_9CAUD|nr:MAG TPA: hypothetical protein [Siphoviridae sp. ctCIv11]